MDKTSEIPIILYLEGVTKKDFKPIENILEDRIKEPIEDEEKGIAVPITWDKPPSVYKGLEDWPLRTNLKCSVCDLTFNDRPKFVPGEIKKDENEKLEIIVLGGIYMCTFNCAMRYINVNLKGEEAFSARDCLLILYKIFTGKTVTRITPSHPKTKRQEYGGAWSIKEWLKKKRL